MVYPVKARFSFVLVVVSIILLSSSAHLKKNSRSPKVHLTVSSKPVPTLAENADRKVVINYYDTDCDKIHQSSTFIALYNHDPNKNKLDYLFRFQPSDCPEGHVVTNYTFSYTDLSEEGLVPKCLSYWVAYLENKKIVHSNCIRTHPTWMSDMKKDIGHMKLNCLMIPGTHHSGLYPSYEKFRDLNHDMYSQEENVFNQLVFGIRYLDIRLFHKGSPKLYLGQKSVIRISHDIGDKALPTFEDVLEEVKLFITSTKEFVIMDFHRFYTGIFKQSTLATWQHKEILKLVKENFDNLIIEPHYLNLDLAELWKLDKRVLITYRDEFNSLQDQSLNDPVLHWWKSANDVKDLHEYLVENACSSKMYLTAAVAVLPPTKISEYLYRSYTRRYKADAVNIEIDKWFRNELSCANIILTDFFLGNNIIEIAIEANKNASRCNFNET